MTISTLTLSVGESSYSYTAYASVAEAVAYLAGDPELYTWLDLDAAVQVRRLVGATRRLDRIPWAGRVAVAGQPLAWPRTGLNYPDGSAVGSTVPPEVVEAALMLAGDTSIDLAASGGGREANVQAQQVGRKRETYFYQDLTELETLLPGGILSILSYWIGSSRRRALASVTGQDKDTSSEFSERYERTIGNIGTSEYLERD